MHKPSGNIHQDTTGKRGKKGSYYVRFRFPDPLTGERKEKIISGLANQAEAKSVLASLMTEHTTGELVIDKGFTVGDGFKLYAEELELRVALGKLKERSQGIYLDAWRLHVAPLWEKRPMAEIKPIDIVRFFGDFSKKEINPLHVWIVMKSSFDIAFKNGYIGANPFLRVKKSEVAPETSRTIKSNKYWTIEQLKTFREAIAKDNHPDRWFYELIIFTGMRRGEALGVCDDAIHLGETPTLEIKRQWCNDSKGRGHWDTPKTTSSSRVVVLTDEAVTAIQEQQFLRASYELSSESEWVNDEGALFVKPEGRLFIPDHSRRVFTQTVRDIGLPEIGLHGLRHSFATVALEAGVSLKILSEMLGHSDTQLTANIYQHVSENVKATAVEQVAGLIR